VVINISTTTRMREPREPANCPKCNSPILIVSIFLPASIRKPYQAVVHCEDCGAEAKRISLAITD
jgi:uncharacterized protein with PIN domain